MSAENFNIDFVITWVDGNDKDWLSKKKKYDFSDTKNDDSSNRYRDFGLLKNWFDRVFKFATWVNKIFLVTDNQAPGWAYNDNRIVIINHEDFIPHENLPLFNSSAIELNLFRIKDLSEHFVYFNDDMYITDFVYPGDFFTSEGYPVLNGGLFPSIPRNDFSKVVFNNMIVINELYPKNKYFKKNFWKYYSINSMSLLTLFSSIFSLPFSNWLGFYEDHLPYPILKNNFYEILSKKNDVINSTSSHRFRNYNDYTIWLIKNISIAKGEFKPRKRDFGQVINFSNENDLKKVIKFKSKYKTIVINDDLDDSNNNFLIDEVKKIMEKY